jgi:hypothetical protein
MLVFIYMLLYEKSKGDEVCEPSKKGVHFRKSGAFFLSLFRGVLKGSSKVTAIFVMSVHICQPIRVEAFHCTIFLMKILYLYIFGKSVEEFQVALRYYRSSRYFK